jgi:hypothetical protein
VVRHQTACPSCVQGNRCDEPAATPNFRRFGGDVQRARTPLLLGIFKRPSSFGSGALIEESGSGGAHDSQHFERFWRTVHDLIE